MTVDAAAASESTPTGVRMLVVDDDGVICLQMTANLSSAGYQVVTAHDGARALAQAEETPPDLAIVDLEMPGTKRRLAAATRNHRAFIEVRVAPGGHGSGNGAGAEASALLAPRSEQRSTRCRSRCSGERVLAGPWCHDRIDCKTDLMARFNPALVERVRHNLAGNAALLQPGRIVVPSRRWNYDESVEISVTNSGPVPASSCSCPVRLTRLAARPGSDAWGKVDRR